MSWQWPKPPGFGYEPQSLPSPYPPQPPHLPHPQRYRPRAQQLPPLPPPALNPPPPPIAQLLPPVNFLANPPVPRLSTSFVHFSAPHVQQVSYNTALPPSFPPQQKALPHQSYYPVQRETSYQPRRNRRQPFRPHREHNPQAKPPARRNSTGDLGVTPYQQPKQTHPNNSERTSSSEVLSHLNTKLPGSSPAEIKAWVDARKANWPSKANVARKKAAEERQKAAGALATSGLTAHRTKSGTDGSERDLAVSRRVLSHLNAKLPGSSPEELAAWVKARKENWPSRTNVARKLAAAAEEKASKVGSRPRDEGNRSGALAKLGDYSSSDDEEEQEKEKKSDTTVSKGKRARRRQGGRGRKNTKKRKTQTQSSAKKPSLLRMLLEREIRQEQSVLLQAFRYIIDKKASEN